MSTEQRLCGDCGNYFSTHTATSRYKCALCFNAERSQKFSTQSSSYSQSSSYDSYGSAADEYYKKSWIGIWAKSVVVTMALWIFAGIAKISFLSVITATILKILFLPLYVIGLIMILISGNFSSIEGLNNAFW